MNQRDTQYIGISEDRINVYGPDSLEYFLLYSKPGLSRRTRKNILTTIGLIIFLGLYCWAGHSDLNSAQVEQAAVHAHQ